MAYTERLDGRKHDELRKMSAKVGIIPNADGSAEFRTGKTWAIAAVYGPREVLPRFMANPKKGFIRCQYTMMPFSGTGTRIRPGRSRRAQEIAMVMDKALEPVVDLTAFPNSVVDIFVELPQTDAGTRCAAITAAAMALADAGIPMRDLVCSVSVGTVDGTVVADLIYDEEAYDGHVSDIPVAMTARTKEITLLQMDGHVTKDQLVKSLEMARDVMGKVYEVQKKALKAKFTEVSK